jgi:hypothetical protein
MLHGINDCVEIGKKGIEKPQKEWDTLFFGNDSEINKTEEEIMKKVKLGKFSF